MDTYPKHADGSLLNVSHKDPLSIRQTFLSKVILVTTYKICFGAKIYYHFQCYLIFGSIQTRPNVCVGEHEQYRSAG